jgi:hypothetical protein
MLRYGLGIGAFCVNNYLVKPFLVQDCMSLFPTLTEYFMYSRLPYFLYIAAMICCSEDEEYFDEDLF